jgi:hypothetical protein
MWRLILLAALVESVGLITSELDDARGARCDCRQCTSGRRDDTGTSINFQYTTRSHHHTATIDFQRKVTL